MDDFTSETAVASTSFNDEELVNETMCEYLGTDYVEEKIYLVGLFATMVALLSILFNSFNCLVYLHSPSLRRSAVFYFGVLSLLDIVMGLNYIAVMSAPVFFDYYRSLPLYHLFLWYFRVVLVESNCAIFASVLLILLATTERLLRTFPGATIITLRRFVEKNRAILCVVCIIIATAYKFCTFFEITYIEHSECADDFSRYEIVATDLVLNNSTYRFWWMFVTRFIVDRTLPFFLLVFMNFTIIKALKRQTFESKHFASGSSTKGSRSNLRDATRTLIVMVSMYIISQSPQVLLTIWEAFDKETLAQEEYHKFYSYMNDIMSICTLLSSCLRFPVYCATNRQISAATANTIRDFRNALSAGDKRTDYKPIRRQARLTNGKPIVTIDTKTTEETVDTQRELKGTLEPEQLLGTSISIEAETEYKLKQYQL